MSLTTNLNWKSHTEYINHKINVGIGIIKKLRYYIQEETLINLYHALIKPHIDYGILAWGSSNKTNLKTIERTMTKAIRLMGFKKKYDSVISIFDSYGLLNLENMIKINQGEFMWKLVNKEQPECIQMMYHPREINALNKNKDKNRYILPYFRTNIGKLSLHYQGIHLWNTEIPREIKNVRNIKKR